jgi:hypothetical protein
MTIPGLLPRVAVFTWAARSRWGVAPGSLGDRRSGAGTGRAELLDSVPGLGAAGLVS